MGTQIKFVWSVAICLGLMVLAHCIPVEIVYTGEGCECPSKLDYQINIPKTPCYKKYTPSEYGYKVDVPVQGKAKVSYSFDFTVEEPRTPKPEKPSKWNLFAKVDRIAVNKEDCEDTYFPAPSPPSSCSCGQCGITKPLYRYVYKKVPYCKCKRPHCQCNLRRTFSPNSINAPNIESKLPSKEHSATNNIRRKRDLHRAFFRPRKAAIERPGRFVKLYHKSLPGKRHALFGFDSLPEPVSKNAKRKAKKTLFPNIHSKIVKRDIKGEYDLMEKEREQMDLTLPEIIQFMPETLQPDFKRDQCNFGCAGSPQTQDHSQDQKSDQSTESDKPNPENVSVSDHLEESGDEHRTELLPYKEEQFAPNSIATSYKKRNAANYNYGFLSKPAATVTHLPSLFPQSAYEADFHYPISTNPFGATQAPHFSLSPHYGVYPMPQLQPQYAYDRSSHKYFENQNGQLRPIESTVDSTPLQYDGDLEGPPSGYETINEEGPIVGARPYPVQHISNTDLDKIISGIIYRHPDFIDASTHYGGAFVDPEPWQEQETKDFLKKLIAGRLRLWFGDEYEPVSHYTSSYSSPQNPYRPPTVLTYFPSSY